MRLYRLQLTGVGPFAGPCEIDFSRLGDAGLFLLEGPTGAGKSSILDAISFALYGKVAQASGDAERLRSHFAGPDDESSVVLVFETQAGSYRIRRTPKYQRPKRRGAGFTTVNATAALWRLGTVDEDPLQAPGELLSNRLDEVADEITRAIGLTHAQFVQTVILPQGEFAGFLRASSDEKRVLLQRLFGAEVLARVQANLVEQRQQAERARARSEEILAHAVQAFAGAAGLDSPAANTESPGAAESAGHAAPDFTTAIAAALAGADSGRLTELTTVTLDQLQARVTIARQQAVHAETARHTAQENLHEAENIVALRVKRARLHQRLEGLQADEPANHRRRTELVAAERAAPIGELAQACQQSAARSEAASTRAGALRVRLGTPWRSADELTVRLRASELGFLLGSLRDHVEAETALRTEAADLARWRAEQSIDVKELATLQTKLDRGETRSQTLEAERDALAMQAAGVAAGELAVVRAEATVQAAVAVDTAAQSATAAQLAAEQALLAEQSAAEDLHALRARRIAGIAGELGMALMPGQPCQVCGCQQHPAPARPASDHVSLDHLWQAEQDLAERTSVREHQGAALAEVVREHTRHSALAGGFGVGAASEQLGQAAAQLAAARTAQDLLTGVAGERAALLEQLRQLHLRREETCARVEVTAERMRRGQVDIGELEHSLKGARAGFGSVAERVVDIDGQLQACQAAATAIGAATTAAASAAQDQTRFAKVLAEAGFTDEADFGNAHRDAQAIGILRTQLADRRAEWLSVTDGLADPAFADPALENTALDLAELRHAAGAADDAAAQAAGQLGGCSDRLKDATARAEQINAIIGARIEVLATTAAAIRLGNLVAGLGDNQLRMDLATYVLVRRFADIVAAANDQLCRISNGRYLLEHSDAKQGNSRSGLGLLVRDLTTDRTRDPATLSGGETFYVSLALALGLADVVRSESGGVDLGTLFIDEGFGTLDSDTLDEVLSVLEGLRAGGRAVGVVSHVAELKARIADRIEVRRNPDGSSRLAVLN